MSFRNFSQKGAIAMLRIAVGWLFFYSGITKVINPEWSAAGYLNNAQSFKEFFSWLASPNLLPFVNFLNEWGLTLIGLSLIFGIFVKLSTKLGIALMLLYYLALDFPYPNEHSFIVDEHIIYSLALLVLLYTKSGQFFGLDKFRSSRKFL